jgi:hypothetical protein
MLCVPQCAFPPPASEASGVGGGPADDPKFLDAWLHTLCKRSTILRHLGDLGLDRFHLLTVRKNGKVSNFECSISAGIFTSRRNARSFAAERSKST